MAEKQERNRLLTVAWVLSVLSVWIAVIGVTVLPDFAIGNAGPGGFGGLLRMYASVEISAGISALAFIFSFICLIKQPSREKIGLLLLNAALIFLGSWTFLNVI